MTSSPGFKVAMSALNNTCLPPLPMVISYRGELREPVACQVEMAVHTKALLNQMLIPTYHFHKESDADEFDEILKYTFMANKPVAILTDASFWGGYGDQ